MRTYDRLYRFLSSYPDVTCDENIKRIEITALDKYMETGIRPDRQYKVNIDTEGQKTEEETT